MYAVPTCLPVWSVGELNPVLLHQSPTPAGIKKICDVHGTSPGRTLDANQKETSPVRRYQTFLERTKGTSRGRMFVRVSSDSDVLWTFYLDVPGTSDLDVRKTFNSNVLWTSDSNVRWTSATNILWPSILLDVPFRPIRTNILLLTGNGSHNNRLGDNTIY